MNQRQVRHSSFNSLHAEVSDAGREARSDYQVAEVYEDEKCGSSVKLDDVRSIMYNGNIHKFQKVNVCILYLKQP
jgi:spermidine synthase